jgi:predicted nucleic acid-binding Zn ribbon protein
MPTYEYIRAKSGHTFEQVQSIKANALSVCPRDLCVRKPWGKGRVRRRIGLGGGLIFKGSGFYTTDYRSENYKAPAKKDTDAQKPAKTDGKSESAAGGKSAATGVSESSAKSSPTPAPAPAKKD